MIFCRAEFPSAQLRKERNLDKPYGKDAVTKAVLEAAVPLIAERGVNAVSLRDIAIAANVHHGLIIRHFGTKEELVWALGDYLGSQLLQTVRGGGDSFPAVLAQLTSENRVQIRAIARIMLDTPSSPPASRATNELMADVVQWFRSQLKIDQAGPEIDSKLLIYTAASLLIGGEVFGTHIQRVLGLDDASYRDLPPQAFSLILRNLTKPS